MNRTINFDRTLNTSLRRVKYTTKEIVLIVFIVLLCLGLIIGAAFLIKSLIKKDYDDLTLFDEDGNVIAFFKHKNCKKIKYNVNDKVILYNTENIPIFFNLPDYMVKSFNVYCKSNLKLNNEPEHFTESRVVIKNPDHLAYISQAFTFGSISLNPVHPFIYGYTPENFLNKFLKRISNLDYKLVYDKNISKNVVYVKFTDLLKLNTSIKDYSDFRYILTDSFIKKKGLSPLRIKLLQSIYLKWYNNLFENLGNVYCTLKTNKSYLDEYLMFENEEELKNKIISIQSKNFNKTEDGKKFNKYSLIFEESNKNVYSLFIENYKLLEKFLNKLYSFTDDKKIVDSFRIIKKYVKIVEVLKPDGEYGDDLDIVEKMENSLLKPNDLEIYLNKINTDYLRKLNFNVSNKKYYSVEPREQNTKILNFKGDDVGFNNYFINNLIYMSDNCFMSSILSEVNLGSVLNPINFTKLKCFNIKSFMRTTVYNKQEDIIPFRLHVNEVNENFKFYNILDTADDLKKSRVDKIDLADENKFRLAFYKPNYKFIDNIQVDINEGKHLDTNKIMLNVIKKLDRTDTPIFKLGQLNSKAQNSTEILTNLIDDNDNEIQKASAKATDAYTTTTKAPPTTTKAPTPSPSEKFTLFNGLISDGSFDFLTESPSTDVDYKQCLNSCKDNSDCQYFVYMTEDRKCFSHKLKDENKDKKYDCSNMNSVVDETSTTYTKCGIKNTLCQE